MYTYPPREKHMHSKYIFLNELYKVAELKLLLKFCCHVMLTVHGVISGFHQISQDDTLPKYRGTEEYGTFPSLFNNVNINPTQSQTTTP